MKVVIQRVLHASVAVEQAIIGKIEIGLLILLGVFDSDTATDVDKLINKIPVLRIFTDENDKMNLSLLDIDGEVLVVSQFTLCADCTHGRRPSFTNSAPPAQAKMLYEQFVTQLAASGIKKVATGEFGAHMEVVLQNSGPVTILLDSKEM